MCGLYIFAANFPHNTYTLMQTFSFNLSNRWLVLLLLLFGSLPALEAHGTVTYPASRIWTCFQEGPDSPESAGCIAAVAESGSAPFYDWNEVALIQAGGRHRELIPDGQLASAGRDKYSGLNLRGSDWVVTPVSPGPLTVTWTISAPHRTLYYRVYITNASYTPDQPLTWDNLELLTETAPRDPARTDNIDVVLPQRTGRHVLYSVWQRSDTPEAFYSTSDIDFGDGSGGGGDPDPPTAYTITTETTGGGSVTLDPASATYPAGSTVTAVATSDTGYKFVGWSGASTSADSTITLTVDQNLRLVAQFEEIGGGHDHGDGGHGDGDGDGGHGDGDGGHGDGDGDGGHGDGDGDNGSCTGAEAVDLNFKFDGSGTKCWVISGDIATVNSWSTGEVLINGEDFTNRWSRQMPDRIDGKYYVSFTAQHPWSHFEARGTNAQRLPSAGVQGAIGVSTTGIVAYPNPFGNSTTLEFNAPEEILELVVSDLSGRVLRTFNQGQILRRTTIGDNLNSGVYLVTARTEMDVRTIRIIKR